MKLIDPGLEGGALSYMERWIDEMGIFLISDCLGMHERRIPGNSSGTSL